MTIDTNQARKAAEQLLCKCGYEDNDWMNPENIQPLIDVLAKLASVTAERDQLARGIDKIQNGGGMFGFNPQHGSLIKLITKLGAEEPSE